MTALASLATFHLRQRWNSAPWSPKLSDETVPIDDALRESEIRKAAILEAALDCVVAIDHEGRITEFNPAAERTFGYGRADAIGRLMAELIIPAAYREAHYKGMARYLQTGEARVLDRRIEITALHSDGSEFPVELSIIRMPVAGPPVFTAFVRDITERKHAEAALAAALAAAEDQTRAAQALAVLLQEQAIELAQQTEEAQALAEELEQSNEELRLASERIQASRDRLHRVFEQAPVGIAIMSGPGHLLETVNAHMLPLVGVGSKAAVIARPVRDAVPWLEGRGLFEILDDVYATGRTFVGTEVAARAPSGTERVTQNVYNFACQAMFDGEGVVEGVCAVAVDVTDLVRAREAAEEARRGAEAASLAKSHFLSTMSHELRTPLNAIGGYAELMEMGLRGDVSDAQREDLGRIRRSGQHLLSLINDILNFARLEAGQLEFDLEPVRLDAMVVDLEQLIAPQVRSRELEYVQDACRVPIVVRADAERLRQVLLNLITNAIKFTSPGGRISVKCETVAGCAMVSVSDNGRGIPANELSRIFEPFVQIDRHLTHGSHQGVGLGLSIARDLARRMDGELSAESTPGEGSVFTLALPLMNAAAETSC